MRESPARRVSRVLFLLMAYRPPIIEVPSRSQRVILTDVTIVNPCRERRDRRTLIIERDRITRISHIDLLDSAEPVDHRYTGTYVLPGLIDMHVHIPPPTRDLVNLLFLAYYTKEFLDEALRRHRERFERPVYDALSTAIVRLGTNIMVSKN
jgi:hypothetical protein